MRSYKEVSPPAQPTWRQIERELIAYFKSSHDHVSDHSGHCFIGVVRYWEGDEPIIAFHDLNALARILADTMRKP